MTRKWIHAPFCLTFLCFFSLLLSLSFPTSALANPERSIFGGTFDTQNIDIRTDDDLILEARLYAPREEHFPGLRPAVIFTNSWTLDHYEYEIPARTLADRGYIVLSYTTRGFRGSQGKIEVGGPREIRDVQTLLDWLETHTRVDAQNIGMAGVSYGGGISLLAAAHDLRIKTVVALSAWGDLEKSLYGNDTIREVWLNILVGSGDRFGELDPSIHALVKDMRAGENEAELRSWARSRSPHTYVDILNARKIPIFVANSYLDGLFPPLQMREFFDKLTVPKKFYLDQGLHASSALNGIFGLPSALWTETFEWLDYYLGRGGQAPREGIIFHSDKGDEVFSKFPRLGAKNFIMRPRNSLTSDREGSFRTESIHIVGNKDSGATSGIPILTDLATTYINKPAEKYLSNIKMEHAAIFESQPLTETLFLRGAPRVEIALGPHESKVQLVAYLYDVNSWNKGRLITHGVMTVQKPTQSSAHYELDLAITGYDIPKGHRLALVLDTVDPLYTPALPPGNLYTVKIIQDRMSPTLLQLPTAAR